MKTVLIVDDSKSMRMMIEATLSSKYKVIQAEDGMVGLNLAKQNQFDLIVSDINMPNMKGYEMVTEIKKLPNYKTVPVLILTTESSQEAKANGKLAGATGWIVKPFTPEKLCDIIERLI